MKELDAIIFDVDGTLADTERDGHRVAFNQAFAKAGLNWDWSIEIYGQLLAITGGKERIQHYIDHFLTDFSYQGDLKAYIADLHAQKTTFYKALLSAGHIPLRTGVKRLLEELRAKQVRMAIATTTTPVNVEYLIRNALSEDALDWFEVIAAGDVVKAKKPAPDIFTYAMEKMQVNPENCIAFEDSRNGFLSAKASGIQDIVVTVNGYTAKDDFEDASLVVADLGEPEQACEVYQGQISTPFINLETLLHLKNQDAK